jgi:hypothetical protein
MLCCLYSLYKRAQPCWALCPSPNDEAPQPMHTRYEPRRRRSRRPIRLTNVWKWGGSLFKARGGSRSVKVQGTNTYT